MKRTPISIAIFPSTAGIIGSTTIPIAGSAVYSSLKGRSAASSGGSFRGTIGFVGGYVGSGFSSAPLNNGLNNGQYEFPEGINYGGHAPRPQQAFLTEKIGPILRRPYKKTLYLDFHTGLGANGVLSVILGKQPAPGPKRELEQMFRPYQANGIEITDPATTPGFFATWGDVIDFVPNLSSRPQSFLAVTMEYGTMGLDAVNELRSANRMILDAEKYNFHCETQARCATRSKVIPARCSTRPTPSGGTRFCARPISRSGLCATSSDPLALAVRRHIGCIRSCPA